MDADFENWFFGTGTDALDTNSNYEITFKLIETIDSSTGYTYINTAQEVALTLPKEDEFQDIAAVVEEATDGDYFKLYGTKDSSIANFDKYITDIQDTTGDSITVFHDIAVYEQITTFFDKTYEMSIVQVENFDEAIPFRPIIQNGSSATAYNIDYTLRIYNETKNTQIVKRASYTSYDIGKYGKKLQSLSLPSSNSVMKVYNTLPNVLENRQITENLASLPSNQVRFVPVFIERLNIVTGSTTVTIVDNEAVDDSEFEYYAEGDALLVLSPYDNYIKFKIAKLNGDDLVAISLVSVDKIVLNLGRHPIDNSLEYDNVDLNEGEIMFKVDEKTINKLDPSTKGFSISIVNGLDKTRIYFGQWTIEG